jgi:hypothetical protein
LSTCGITYEMEICSVSEKSGDDKKKKKKNHEDLNS